MTRMARSIQLSLAVRLHGQAGIGQQAPNNPLAPVTHTVLAGSARARAGRDHPQRGGVTAAGHQ